MNFDHIEILKKGVQTWNRWRNENPTVIPDLRGANLEGPEYPIMNGINLSRADMTRAYAQFLYISGADLTGASLVEAQLWGTNFSSSRLTGANLSQACLRQAFLDNADLQHAEFIKADLSQACAMNTKLYRAQLREADMLYANLNSADLTEADLTDARIACANLTSCNITRALLDGCHIHGVLATDVIGEPASQARLNISPYGTKPFHVDDLRTAGLVHMLRAGDSWSRVVHTLTNRAVLILGRFTEERRLVLEAIAEGLRLFNDLPIIFTFDTPPDRSVSETVRILAGLSQFVIVDLTVPKSSPFESHLVVPDMAVPIFPIIQRGEEQFSMFDDLYDYPWVLRGFAYENLDNVRISVPRLRKAALTRKNEINALRASRCPEFLDHIPLSDE